MEKFDTGVGNGSSYAEMLEGSNAYEDAQWLRLCTKPDGKDMLQTAAAGAGLSRDGAA
jgi:hypothetical protein